MLAAGVSNQAPDAEHFPGLVNETIRTTGQVPDVFTADAGYHSLKNVAHARALGSEALIPPDKLRRSEWRAQQAPEGRIPKGLSIPDRMRRKLATKAGKRLYLQRQASMEPVFDATKGARGLRQFLHRGTDKNHHLFRFDMAVHNVLKIVGQAQRCLERSSSEPHQRRRSTPTSAAAAAA